MNHTSEHRQSAGMAGRSKWVLGGFLAIGAFFLLTEHRAHLFGILPYLLLLACPLMHVFHHHGHHRHGAPGEPRIQEKAGTGAGSGEERDSIAAFGDACREYRKEVPAFVPRFKRPGPPPKVEHRERHG